MMSTLKTSVASAAAALALAVPAVSQAVVPLVDAVGRGAQIVCGTTPAGTTIYAAHADKIIFRLAGQLQAANAADQPILDLMPRNTELDIKVLDNPKKVADLKGKVLTFIGAVDNSANRGGVGIQQVQYAMVCPTGL